MLSYEIENVELVKLREWTPPDSQNGALNYLRFRVDGEPSHRELYVDKTRVNGSMPEMGGRATLLVESHLKAIPKRGADGDYVTYIPKERIVGVSAAKRAA